MRRALTFLFLLLIFSMLVLVSLFVRNQLIVAQHPHVLSRTVSSKMHILGGFSIDTPERAIKAATDGIQVVFQYSQPPSETDSLGQQLQSLHMKVMDGYISSYLFYYECHRTQTVNPPPTGQAQFCQYDDHPELTDEKALLATVAAHLKQVKDNQLIIGYWVLDDWVPWDAGSAKQILIEIHSLIQQYTPGRPAICGFGASLEVPNRTSGWSDWVAENFSPQGCDDVGFYIYAPSLHKTTPALSADAYDWSMSALLPAMFASLRQRGWNIEREQLIGIGQAFGGPIAQTNDYWVTPNAKDIETQSRSFCEHGATGLAFYGWDSSGFGPATQTPMNSPDIRRGIRSGIAACNQYWNNHP